MGVFVVKVGGNIVAMLHKCCGKSDRLERRYKNFSFTSIWGENCIFMRK